MNLKTMVISREEDREETFAVSCVFSLRTTPLCVGKEDGQVLGGGNNVGILFLLALALRFFLLLLLRKERHVHE